jgi:hypothetical protein
MDFDKRASGGIRINFENEEVRVMSSAQQEYNTHLADLGNNSSVSPHMQMVANMRGNEGYYAGPDHRPPIEALSHYVEITEEAVDEILSQDYNHLRIEEAGERMRMGDAAEQLMKSIVIQSRMDSELSDLLGETPIRGDMDDLLGTV